VICWVFAAITLAAVMMATFVEDIRRAVLALWVAGLGIGAVYLTVGAETLAIVQWIVSTLVAISFVFFSVMFGEYVREVAAPKKPADPKRLAPLALGTLIGLAFVWVIWLGVREQLDVSLLMPVAGESGGSVGGNDLLALGRALADRHLLSLEVLALTLFLVLVGGGVIARPDNVPSDENSAGGRASS